MSVISAGRDWLGEHLHRGSERATDPIMPKDPNATVIYSALLAAGVPLPVEELPGHSVVHDRRVKNALRYLYYKGSIEQIYQRQTPGKLFEVRTEFVKEDPARHPFNEDIFSYPEAYRRVNAGLGLTRVLRLAEQTGDLRPVQASAGEVTILYGLLDTPAEPSEEPTILLPDPRLNLAPLDVASDPILRAGSSGYRPFRY